MADVFISYSREDRAAIERLAAALEGRGFSVWWDRNIGAGSEFSRDIERELGDAKAVVVAWSKHASESRWVKDEALVGAESGKLVPASLDGAAAPLGFRQFQTVVLAGSHFDPNSPAMSELLSAIQLRTTGAAPPPARSQRFSLPRLPIILLAGAAILLGGGALFLPALLRKATPQTIATATEMKADPSSVAVLPFADLSEAHDQQYFSDGIAEEILNVLASLPGLKVAGRTSSFKFRGVNDDLRDIGRQLGVAHVLEGSVRKQGDKVRVTAQLIKVEDGFHLWSQTFDRDLTDIFAVQDEISRVVAQKLSLHISTEKERSHASDVAAYDLYLRGREQLAERGLEALRAAADYFRSASQIDPNFSRALSGRARALSVLWDYGFTTMSSDTLAEAKGAAEAALKADPANAEAYSVLGYLNVIAEWNWSEADRDIRRALELAPNDAEIANFAGDYFMYVGDVENSFANERRAIALDPLHAVNYQDLAWRLMAAGRCDEALAQSLKATEIDPQFGVDFLRSRAFFCLKNLGEARKAIERMRAKGFRNPARDGLFRLAIDDGNIAEARRLAGEAAKDGAGAYHFSAEYAVELGDYDAAAKFLEAAYQARDPRFIIDYTHMSLEDWPDDPRIRAALDKPELNALYDIRRRNLARWKAARG